MSNSTTKTANSGAPKRWWRGLSLRARVLLMLFGMLILTQVVTMVLLMQYRQNLISRNAADVWPVTLRMARQAIAQQPPHERAAYVAKFSGGQWQVLETVDESTAVPPPRVDIERGMNQLRRLAGPRAKVLFVPEPEPSYLVSLEHIGSQWLKIPIARFNPPTPWPLIAMWGMFSLLIFALAAWFSWHLTRPLQVMAKATQALARGTPERVQPEGPSEVRQLGEQFNEMLDELEAAQRNRSVMLAGLPHDLKTPLARLRLRAAMTDDATLRDGITADVQQMQRILDQFLVFARGADQVAYVMQPINLSHWLQEYALNWEGQQAQVQVQHAEQAYRIQADAIALTRLLDNLISNAQQYGIPSQPQQTVPVKVSLSPMGDGVVRLSVIDHGPGIADADKAKALDPFVRLQQGRTADGHSGLGLSIAKGIAHAHQAQIQLLDTPGGGLTVACDFPLDTGLSTEQV